MKLYTSNSTLDFGKYKNQKIELILVKENQYINWCFQKLDSFCISDELFNQINFIAYLKKNKSKECAEQLEKMEVLHREKKKKYESFKNENKDTKMYFFPLNSRITFGKYKPLYINDVLIKDNNYIKWCFENIDSFAISIDVFDSLDYIKHLRENRDKDEFKIELKRLEELFAKKLKKYNQQNTENCYYSDYRRRLTNPDFQYGKIHKSNQEKKNIQEVYKDIPGYENFYQASKSGKIKSIEREVHIANQNTEIKKEKILKPEMTNYRDLVVRLYNGNSWQNEFVKNLVALTYLDFKLDDSNEVIHIDSNPVNNSYQNLKIIPKSMAPEKIHYFGGSKYKGVKWNKTMQCWRTNLFIDNITYVIGFYENEEDAALAYKIELEKYNKQGSAWIENFKNQIH